MFVFFLSSIINSFVTEVVACPLNKEIISKNGAMCASEIILNSI